MKKNKDKILIIKKFKSSKRVSVLLSLGLFFFLVCYIIILVIVQFDEYIETINFFGIELIVIVNVVRDLLLILVLIIGTTLLTANIIEKNQKNTTYTELDCK